MSRVHRTDATGSYLKKSFVPIHFSKYDEKKPKIKKSTGGAPTTAAS
jgi:hypothetical protein